MAQITPSQTIGPFFSIALAPNGINWRALAGNDLVTLDTAGERIAIEGRVLDGDGRPVNDSLLEIWQADAAGRYAHPVDDGMGPNTAFKGFGRTVTDETGVYRFATIKPGAVPHPNGIMQAPHIVMAVFARGMLCHRYTRIYFADEPNNPADPVLALVPAERRGTLLAHRGQPGEDCAYRFDVRLQGEDETVFFDL